MERFKILSKNQVERLPMTTGVYSFWEKNKVIYIGKATNIKSRIKNHFNQPGYRDNLFMDKVNKIGFFETGSEIEALILEANLIKKYQPKFNVMWRDDKNYFYVAIAQNENKIPYVFITHQPKNFKFQISNFKFELVGPFTEGVALKKTLRFLRRVFPYYTSAKHSKNKCTYCHLDLCPGPYDKEALRQNLRAKNGDPFFEYKKNIKKLILILKGKRRTVLNSLKKEMAEASKLQNFEKAGEIRDKIYALQQVMLHTHVINGQAGGHPMSQNIGTSDVPITDRIECYDVSNIQGKQATGSMVVFTNGKPDKNQYRKFKIRLPEKPNDIAMLKEILKRRFNHPEWQYPDAILIDGGKAQLNAAIEIKNSKNYFKNLKIKNLKIISIAKGRQELFVEGEKKPTPLKQLPQETYNLIKNLDDEAHRFALSYHKTLRKKKLLS